ncbi:hypothetical protein OG249_37400 [Streptomyces microflavus]|uniref:hypothetical protein n=1 Tax=Streptomyces microflavus TaxID=1919 RepID=UPI002259B7F7|nr:hypothetical protein [Streptomyces microflavus]MCX4657536.1 hypothetical protein [Streptomyces microflavus]
MTVTSIAAFAAASSVSPPAPVLVSTLPTGAGADVHVYRDTDGSLSSECTGCGEYAWTLRITREFAREHAATCLRRPRPLAA